jgi:hypothetical protein
MIQLPRRSVTRFFIPLIDVLTLLFCIFLLLPLIKSTGDGASAQDQPAVDGKDAHAGPKDMKRAREAERAEQDRLKAARQELADIRKEKMEALQQRLFIRVLEIDADTGRLFYQEGDQRTEIRNQSDALKLISRHRDEAGERELYYLFMYPRRLTGYPQRSQIQRYMGWFKEVAHGVDNPLAG